MHIFKSSSSAPTLISTPSSSVWILALIIMAIATIIAIAITTTLYFTNESFEDTVKALSVLTLAILGSNMAFRLNRQKR